MNFYTTILGSGAALPTVARHCSGQVVNVNGTHHQALLLAELAKRVRPQRPCPQSVDALPVLRVQQTDIIDVLGVPLPV